MSSLRACCIIRLSSEIFRFLEKLHQKLAVRTLSFVGEGSLRKVSLPSEKSIPFPCLVSCPTVTYLLCDLCRCVCVCFCLFLSPFTSPPSLHLVRGATEQSICDCSFRSVRCLLCKQQLPSVLNRSVSVSIINWFRRKRVLRRFSIAFYHRFFLAIER